MTIKLRPDCELERALYDLSLKDIVKARWAGNDPASNEHQQAIQEYEKARAHLLEVIQAITAKGFWNGYTVGRDSRRIFTEREAVQWADKFMGAMSDG